MKKSTADGISPRRTVDDLFAMVEEIRRIEDILDAPNNAEAAARVASLSLANLGVECGRLACEVSDLLNPTSAWVEMPRTDETRH